MNATIFYISIKIATSSINHGHKASIYKKVKQRVIRKQIYTYQLSTKRKNSCPSPLLVISEPSSLLFTLTKRVLCDSLKNINHKNRSFNLYKIRHFVSQCVRSKAKAFSRWSMKQNIFCNYSQYILQKIFCFDGFTMVVFSGLS